MRSFLILVLLSLRFIVVGFLFSFFLALSRTFSISLASALGELGVLGLFSNFAHKLFTVSVSFTGIPFDIASVTNCSFFISRHNLPFILYVELPFSIVSRALHILSFLFLFLTPTTPNFLATCNNTDLVRRSHLRPPIFIVPSLSYVILVFFVFCTLLFFTGFLFGFLKQQSYPCGFFLTSNSSLHGGRLILGHVEAFVLSF